MAVEIPELRSAEGNLLFLLLSKSRIQKLVHNLHRNMSGTITRRTAI